MDALPVQFYSAIGAIVAALIGGFLSLLSLTTSKDQKVSELRHEWITGFRDELAALTAELKWTEFWAEQFKADPGNSGKNPWVEDAYKTSYLAMAKLSVSLRLRVNVHVKDASLRSRNQAFLTKLEEIVETRWTTLTPTAVESLTRELRDLAAPILQAEWERIEQGEKGHRILKRVAVAFLISGLLGVIGVAAWLARLSSRPATQPPVAAPQSSPQPSPGVNETVRGMLSNQSLNRSAGKKQG